MSSYVYAYLARGCATLFASLSIVIRGSLLCTYAWTFVTTYSHVPTVSARVNRIIRLISPRVNLVHIDQ